MNYAGARKIIDADSHIIELDDLLTNFASPEDRHLIPPMMDQKHLTADQKAHDRGKELFEKRSKNPEMSAKFESTLMDNKISGWNRFGAFDPTERSKAMDIWGYKRQLVLPTFTYHQVGHAKETDVMVAGASALNRAMANFCSHDPRLRAIGYIPLRAGPEVAVELMAQGFNDGCYSFMVDTNEPDPKARSFTHPDFDPVWALFAKHNAPFVIHVAVTGEYEPIPKSFFNNGLKTPELGGDAPSGALGMVAIAQTAQLFLAAMIFDDVFIRHPNLKGIAMEFGAVWLPSWLQSMDVGHDVFKIFMPHLKKREIQPSEYARKHIKVSPFAGEPLDWIIDQVGPDMLVYASDFPHPEGTSDPIGKFEKTMQNCTTETMAKFYYKNMEAVTGEKLPA